MVAWSDIEAFALTLDGVTAAFSYSAPSLKMGKVLVARLRVADNSVVLKSVDIDERDMLIAAHPKVFFIEDHYRGYDIMLARLDQADLDDLAPYIERTSRLAAGKRKGRKIMLHPALS